MQTKAVGWNSDRIFDAANTAFMLLLLFIFIYPLDFVLIASVSDPYAVVRGEVFLYPKGWSVEAYENVFANSQIWLGYLNSFIYTLGGTSFNLLLTIPAAYAMSKRYLPCKRVCSWMFFITMFFGGGLVPTYLEFKAFGLIDTRLILMIVGGISIYNMVICRTFYQTAIPDALYEAARIDGASEMRMFSQIAVPLSLPIIAVMALYYGVGHWNGYFSALIYTSNKNLEPLQLVLRRVLILNQSSLTSSVQNSGSVNSEEMAYLARKQYVAEAMKYSLVIVASTPLLVAYPFVQKFFVKGVMIGALKE